MARASRGDRGTVVFVPYQNEAPLRARLLCLPLPPDRAAKSRAVLRRNAAKKGRAPSRFALRQADYFWLLTTLPVEVANDDLVLEIYRIRWQIELYFKRLKSLLDLDGLRAFDPDLARAYCLSKLIAAVLIELLEAEPLFFSPWGYPLRRSPAVVMADV